MTSPPMDPAIGPAILAASGDGAALFSPDLRVTWANDRSHELLRARPGSLVGRHLFSFMASDEVSNPKPDWRALYERRVRNVPMQARNDLVLTRDDTTQAAFVVGASRFPDDTVLILFNEFEGRAEIEKEAAALAVRYQDLFQSIPIAVWELDMRDVARWLEALPCEPDETVDYLTERPSELLTGLGLLTVRAVNRAGIEQHHASSGDGASLRDALLAGASPGRWGGFPAQFQAVRTRTQSIITEGVGGSSSGQVLDLEVHQFIPRDGNGLDLSRVIVTLVDTSHAKATQAALESAVAARDRLISSVAHELRTPLTVVTGLLQLLRDAPGNLAEGERLELVAVASANAEDLNHLIDDLLTYSRIDTSEWHISPSATDLRSLVSDLDVRDEAGERLVVPIEGEATCLADPRRVRQIIRNLATNTIRYGGPTMGVRLWANEVAHLEWRDDGRDLGPDMDRIFEPFQRAHPSPTQPSSLGLGLTISRGLAEAMSGRLDYRRDDGWTVFDLTLPLVGEAAASGPT